MPLTVWWLVAAVVIAPLAFFPATTGVTIAQAKNVVVIVAALALVVWRLPHLWAQALAVLSLLAFMATGFSGWALTGVLGIFGWLVVYGEASRLTDDGWRLVRRAIAAAALVQIAWMGVQAAGADPIFTPLDYRGGIPLRHQDGGRIVACHDPEPAARARCLDEHREQGYRVDRPAAIGWFDNPMDTALFVGLSLPAVSALSPWLLVLGGAAIWSLGATAGAVCFAIAALWTAPSWRWRAALAAVLIVGGTWFLAIRDPQGAGLRPTIWRNAATLALHRPVLGWGPNAVGYRIQTIHPVTHERWDFVFNEWLQGALELGLAGPALVLGYLGSLAWRLRRRWRELGEELPAVLALLAVSTFSIPLRVGPVALLGALYLGRLEGKVMAR